MADKLLVAAENCISSPLLAAVRCVNGCVAQNLSAS